LQDLPNIGDLKIGLNALNGSAGAILPQLVRKIKEKMQVDIKLFECEMNSQLNTVLDPSNQENIKRMQKDLEMENIDVIFAFDGDADRIMAITKEKVFYGEDILFFCVREVFSKIKKGNVIFDVKCSNVLKNEIEKFGGTPIMYKTGHSFIKEKMVLENAVLGGEASGHIYFKDGYYGFDDGIYTAIRVISYLVNSKKKIGEIISEIQFVWKSPEIKICCLKKFAVIEEIQLLMKEMDMKFNDIDGIRCEISNSAWFLVRASNTEEIIVVKYEAETKDEFVKVEGFVKEILGKFNLDWLQ
jgi:phosphomannomutase